MSPYIEYGDIDSPSMAKRKERVVSLEICISASSPNTRLPFEKHTKEGRDTEPRTQQKAN
ncbi:hypothetical protein EON64_15835 [archaeon]|nr:MAG: hypothetical protein EON64_15835 [archaeon]